MVQERHKRRVTWFTQTGLSENIFSRRRDDVWEGEEDIEREGGTNTDINIEEDIVEDDNDDSPL